MKKIHLYQKFIYAYWLVASILVHASIHAQVRRPVLSIPMGHQLNINSLCMSSNGRWIVTGSSDNSFILWDARTGLEIRKVNAGDPVQQVLFSADDAFIYTVTGQANAQYVSTKKYRVKKWNALTGKLEATLPFTALPDMQLAPVTGNLLVNGYSEDLSDKKGSTLTNPTNPASPTFDATAFQKQMTDMMTAITKDTANLRKRMKGDYNIQNDSNYQKLMQSIGSTAFQKDITIWDTRKQKKIGVFPGSVNKMTFLTYQGTGYAAILNDESGRGKNAKSVKLYPIDEMVNANIDNRLAKPRFNFMFMHRVGILEASHSQGWIAIDSHPKREPAYLSLWRIGQTSRHGLVKPKGESILKVAFSPDDKIVYTLSFNQQERYFEGWNTSDLTQIASLTLPINKAGNQFVISPANDLVVFSRGRIDNELLLLNNRFDSIGVCSGHTSSPSYYGFTNRDSDIFTNYQGFFDMEKFFRVMALYTVEHEMSDGKKKYNQAEKEQRIKEEMAKMNYSKTDNTLGYNLVWDLVSGGAMMQKADTIPARTDTVSADKNYVISTAYIQAANRDIGPNMPNMFVSGIPGVSNTTRSQMAAIMDTAGPYYKAMFPSRIKNPVTWLVNRKTKDTVSLINIDSSEWIMLLQNGYYMSSKNAAKMLSYISGNNIFPFEQFDLKYNRPDLVLNAIGKSSPSLIDAYRKAYLKRLKRTGIDSSLFNREMEAPRADFNNRDKINADQKDLFLELNVGASDEKAVLDRFNVWVNDVPLFGSNGISIRWRNRKQFDSSLQVRLSQGKNRIETSVINVNGTESYRSPIYVNYTAAKPVKEKIFFVGIGANRFADSRNNLQYSVKDIRDLAARLKNKLGDRLRIDTLFDEQVTVEKITGLKKQLLQSSEDDKVIIAYSGHGLLSKDYDYYLSTYSIDFNKPEEKGLSYEALENLLDKVPARKKLMLIDACHSGEVDKESFSGNAIAGDSSFAAKGIKPTGIKPSGNQLGLKNSFDMMQYLFVNVARNTGATIISAAGAAQFAQERGDLKNGVFTYSILEFLDSHSPAKVSALKKYVSARVTVLTKGLQVPTTRTETISVDWDIW